MRIFVGVEESVSNDSGWWRVLEQEKLPFERVNSGVAPVTVFEESTPPWITEYLNNGGVAIVSGARSDHLSFEHSYFGNYVVRHVYFNVDRLGVIDTDVLCDLFGGQGIGEIRLHENRLTKGGVRNGRVPAIVVRHFGLGALVYTGVPLTRLIVALGDRLRRFSDLTPVTERVTSVDKWKLIRVLVWALQRAFAFRKIPYAHLWYYPGSFDSAFNFRIDGDGLFGENIQRILSAADTADLPLTIFLNKSLCATDAERLRSIEARHDVGNHANIHNLFDGREENAQNVRECETWLTKVGIDHGPWFAAPRGMWNSNLGVALEDLRFEFSSDFGLDIDSLPFFPRIRGTRLRLLQIPVHPYSAERATIFADENASPEPKAEALLNYFLSAWRKLASRHLPAHFYSHPQVFGLMAEDVLPALVKEVRDSGSTLIWGLSAFSAWWKFRDSVQFTYDFAPATNELTFGFSAPDRAEWRSKMSINVVTDIRFTSTFTTSERSANILQKNTISPKGVELI